MAERNKNKVYQVYDEIIDWFDSHRNKELTMENFYLNLIQKYTQPRKCILVVVIRIMVYTSVMDYLLIGVSSWRTLEL